MHFSVLCFAAFCFLFLQAIGFLPFWQQHFLPFAAVLRRRSRYISPIVFGALSFALLFASPALATPPSAADPVDSVAAEDLALPDSPRNVDQDLRDAYKPVTTKGGFRKGVSRTSYLLGDMFGLRKELNKYGISVNILETSETLGNVAGGVRQGPEYDGLTQMILQMDTQRAFHWYGGTFNVSALQIHGSQLSALNLDSLQTASGLEADRATRLWELWYDQKFGQTGRFDVKVGQQSLDQEFMISQNALLFVNTMFGWPILPSADLPGGGPAYPLSALGVRARMQPANSWTVLAGVFNGSPASNNNSDDLQQTNSSGTSFHVNGGALMIAELQFTSPALGAMVRPCKMAHAMEGEMSGKMAGMMGCKMPLSRVYKLGAWYDTEQFADQRFDNTGLSLANPASTGVPQTHRGDYALYAVADQMIWMAPNDDDRNLNLFVRATGTPEADRNLIDFSLNAGITLSEPIKHRDDDMFGLGMGYAHVSGGATALDRDFGLFTGSAYPVRSGETFIEATYSYQVSPWYQLQPTFQYVFNPGGGIANPNSPSGQQIKNEPVFGLRMNFAF